MPNINKIRYLGTDYDILKEELEAKANVDGSYDTLTAGGAKQLLSTVGITDKVPYTFRTAGGSVDIGDRLMEKVVGGTIAWNQKLSSDQKITSPYEKYGVTFTPIEGRFAFRASGTFSFTSGDRHAYIFRQVGDNYVVKEHKYLITNTSKYFCAYIYSATSGNTFSGNRLSVNNQNGVIVNPNYNGAFNFSLNMGSNIANETAIDEVIDLCMFDLTQMFGATIADYIYSLEQATAGAGVAWFKKLFPKDYYAYNAGELMSVKAASHDTVGFNAWDEVWETGYISNGVNTNGNGLIRSKNYIHVLPDTTYYLTSNADLYIAYYDADKNYLGGLDKNGYGHTVYNGTSAQHLRTMPTNCHYIRFHLSSATYNNDICINLSWDGERDGEYEAYVKHSYALDPVDLRGIPKLDSNNSLYYDGDVYESDGTVTRKYGIYTFDGTEQWSRVSHTLGSTTQYYFRLYSESFTSKIKNSKGGGVFTLSRQYGRLFAQNYWYSGAFVGDKYAWTAGQDGTSYGLCIRDDAYTDEATFKEAIIGMVFVYELATPTTETADPYQNPQIVDDFGTEEYVDAGVIAETRDVAIPVGHESIYQANLRAKLEMSPNSPDGDGDYIVRQTNGLNEYVPYQAELPTLPNENGTYVLKVTVSGSLITLSWVAEE